MGLHPVEVTGPDAGNAPPPPRIVAVLGAALSPGAPAVHVDFRFFPLEAQQKQLPFLTVSPWSALSSRGVLGNPA